MLGFAAGISKLLMNVMISFMSSSLYLFQGWQSAKNIGGFWIPCRFLVLRVRIRILIIILHHPFHDWQFNEANQIKPCEKAHTHNVHNTYQCHQPCFYLIFLVSIKYVPEKLLDKVNNLWKIYST